MRARVAGVYRTNSKLHVHYQRHPNLLWHAQARRVDRVWVGDVTYIRVGRIWRFLAMVMDQFSRRVLGWSLARVRNTSLTRAAFDHAIRRRRPGRGLIFHSDRGSEYLGPASADGCRRSASGRARPAVARPRTTHTPSRSSTR